jgi:hypothetical protein
MDSLPSIMPYAMVNAAPTPTHTAYDVPTGKVFRVYDNPNMLSKQATMKMMVGRGCENPSDFPSATAQTHSMHPDATRTIQAITAFLSVEAYLPCIVFS